MTRVTWHDPGARQYEAGVDHGVYYPRDENGVYTGGVPWNGLVSVSESPTGGEPSPQYADNRKYLVFYSAEEFGATVEAFTYPREFAASDGMAKPAPGVYLTQQSRKTFGLSYRTLVGNELDGTDYGYKLHLIYGAMAGPTEKSRNTINESPEASNFSWPITTDPVEVGEVDGVMYKPVAHLVFDSTDPDVDPADLQALEDLLYGTEGTEPSLPTPAEVIAIFAPAV